MANPMLIPQAIKTTFSAPNTQPCFLGDKAHFLQGCWFTCFGGGMDSWTFTVLPPLTSPCVDFWHLIWMRNGAAFSRSWLLLNLVRPEGDGRCKKDTGWTESWGQVCWVLGWRGTTASLLFISINLFSLLHFFSLSLRPYSLMIL
jgi:hypothetical protein